ncbi:MAG: Lrp/AsnC family transcriptional regulator [Candidatus Methanoliparum thermophilum]|uniref:Lrp/AsnC family transcriptional regulator n=1 Tax=Methanoliparum thermophilum TaxID=2491083 RepID=A0A520KRV5_METT2|nr:Lrp/AsnC family transcriptional regulator [Candidatus Methanoliparum sp. LAM-1]RZN64520.1 MAG: Lrp/AsnC family transcriptional regulator [Candidatus Methanoliparum thermophilum]BDC35884.1 AsnC family transcriptional regulator [Candidatus Methanoliparum sp. LAM-1]
MDELDKKILKVLQEDARLSYTKIAKRVGTSTATVSDRVRRLEKSGMIKGYSVILNSSKIGITTLIAIICVKPLFSAREIGKKIAELRETCYVYNITGDFDLIASFKCFSLTEREECKSIIDKINKIDGIERINTYIVLDTIKEESQIGWL